MGDLFGLLGVPLTAPLASTDLSSLEAHVGAFWGTLWVGWLCLTSHDPQLCSGAQGAGRLVPGARRCPARTWTSGPFSAGDPLAPPSWLQQATLPAPSPSLLATPKNPTTPRSENGGGGSQGTFSKKCVSECGECKCLVSQASARGVWVHLCAPVSCLSLSLCHFLCCASAVSVCVSAGPVVLGPLFGETEPLPIQNSGPSRPTWPASCRQVSGG